MKNQCVETQLCVWLMDGIWWTNARLRWISSAVFSVDYNGDKIYTLGTHRFGEMHMEQSFRLSQDFFLFWYLSIYDHPWTLSAIFNHTISLFYCCHTHTFFSPWKKMHIFSGTWSWSLPSPTGRQCAHQSYFPLVAMVNHDKAFLDLTLTRSSLNQLLTRVLKPKNSEQLARLEFRFELQVLNSPSLSRAPGLWPRMFSQQGSRRVAVRKERNKAALAALG